MNKLSSLIILTLILSFSACTSNTPNKTIEIKKRNFTIIDNYCYSKTSLWDCIDKKVKLEGKYVQIVPLEERCINCKPSTGEYEFQNVVWGDIHFENMDLGVDDPFSSNELKDKRIYVEGIPRLGEWCCGENEETYVCQCMSGQEAGRWPNRLEVTSVERINLTQSQQR